MKKHLTDISWFLFGLLSLGFALLAAILPGVREKLDQIVREDHARTELMISVLNAKILKNLDPTEF